METTYLMLAYVAGLLGVLFWLLFKTKQERERPVKSEKMLRGAGHSLSVKIERRTEKLFLRVILIVCLPLAVLLFGGSFLSDALQGWNFAAWLGGMVGLGALLAWFLSFRIKSLANESLGLQGERLVGETLNWLMKDGYGVFHDYPIEPDGKSGNVDHVVVGPNGVFAIETKAVRKPKEAPEGKNYEVMFDGKRLKYPHFTTKKGGIGQATQNARLLAKHLSSSIDELVEVVPILTLPGWFVESQSSHPLLVLNPKVIRGVILRRDACIDESLQKKISYQLELRCRDVEF